MTTKIKVFILFIILFSACKREEIRCDIIKEEKGLSCDTIRLLANEAPMVSPLVALDSTIEMSFTGLTGFRHNGNIVYPGGTLKVIDENGEVIFKLDDVFIDYDETGVSKDLVYKNISMFLEVGSPMKPGCSYTWENTIWDKRANRKIIGKTKITVE